MSNILYLECNSGISGDMTVAALLDLGASQEVLMEAIDSIPAEGFSVEISRVKKSGIDCCDFNVILDEEHENHDHDMEYLHGHHHGEEIHEHVHTLEHTHEHGHEHHHGEEEHPHEHCHSHGEEEHTHGHGHVHRGMEEVTDIIYGTKMTDNARKIALRIFDIIARAEAKAHAVSMNKVHFHEVGAIDSIVDVVAVAVCLDDLKLDGAIVPKLCEGTGTVRCQHGILPVPVPAVANIVKENNLNLEIMNLEGEFVTPTGAAIAAAVKTSDVLPETFRIKGIGLGAGKRTYDRPSILRAMLIEPAVKKVETEKDSVYCLETNIDDCSGEVLGYVMELLFEAGARDVYYYPIYMKKNRPAWQLNILCDEDAVPRMEGIVFRETTTIGIRKTKMERTVLSRESRQVEISCGTAEVKICRYGENIKYYPEYESVKKICRETGRPYQDIYQEIIRKCE